MKQQTKFKDTEIGEIPEDWEVKSIEEVSEVVGGGTPSTKDPENFGGGIPWITPKDLSGYNKVYIEKGERSITRRGLENSSAKLLPKGTVLLTTRAPIGYVAIAKCEMATNQGFRNLVPNKKTMSLFLYYLLKLNTEKLKSNSSGTTFGELAGSVLKSLKFPFPKSKEEQEEIGKILWGLDEKIELNQKMNKTLEAIGEAIFKRWFIDFEFPNEQGKSYKSSGRKMVESELGMIPAGWRVGFLGDKILTEIIKPGINTFQGEKIYLDTSSVQDSSITDLSYKINMDDRPTRANMQPITNSVWFAKMKESRKILFFDIFSKYYLEKFILSTGFAGLKALNYSLYYTYNFILKENFEDLKDNLCNGTTMQAINNENITKINILIPDKKTLIEFNKVIKPLFEKIYNAGMENQALSQIRDLLLPKLMSGEIRRDLP